jgi:hypothetical protein
MRTLLPGAFISENAKSLCKISSAEVARNSQAARTSSRTK